MKTWFLFFGATLIANTGFADTNRLLDCRVVESDGTTTLKQFSIIGAVLSPQKTVWKTGVFKIIKESDRTLEATGPYNGNGVLAAHPYLFIWDKRSGDMRITGMDFSHDWQGKCRQL